MARLEGEPECEKARQLEQDFPERREIVSIRVAELPLLLDPLSGLDNWSV
jgi:hypothetical protein